MTRSERAELVRLASMPGYDPPQEIARAELRMSHNSAKYAPRNGVWRHELDTCKCVHCRALRRRGKGHAS